MRIEQNREDSKKEVNHVIPCKDILRKHRERNFLKRRNEKESEQERNRKDSLRHVYLGSTHIQLVLTLWQTIES